MRSHFTYDIRGDASGDRELCGFLNVSKNGSEILIGKTI